MRGREVPLRALATLLTSVLMFAGHASAQSPEPTPAGYAFELEITDRWLHGRQRPEFTPWSEPDIRNWLYIDSVSSGPEPGERELRVTLMWPDRAWYARLMHDSAGRIVRIEETHPEPGPEPGGDFSEAMRRAFQGSRLETSPIPAFGYPALDAAALIPSFAPPRLEPGATWVDTLSLGSARGDGFHRSVTGTRWSRLERDTVISGRRLWIVSDSARVRYVERWEERDRTLDTPAHIDRGGEGVIRGSHLYDPELILFYTRTDTIRVAGEATLRYPDGREFRTPAEYERRTRWRLHDPEGAAARREEQLAELDAQRTGMLILPRTELESRLQRDDPRLRDSLIAEWHAARDPEERRRLLNLVGRGGGHRPEIGARLRELALEAGDTTYVLHQLRMSPTPDRPLQVADLELLLPFLQDPGVSLAFGTGRDAFYEAIREALVRAPPAIAPHPEFWPCTPEACQRLIELYDAPGDQRLRDLALIARFAIEPARWADEIQRRADEGAALVRPAAQLLAGVGATWPAAAQAPLPPAGADWRDWLHWMAGPHPDFRPLAVAGPAPSPIRFDPSHCNAIRFYEVRTGRAVVDEIRDAYSAAESDSARLVFGAILSGMGERHSTPDDLAAALRSGSDAERSLALRELPTLFRTASPAEPELSTGLVHRLLEVVIAGAEPWPGLTAAADPRWPQLSRVATGDLPVYILADSLSVELREQWRERATLIGAADWETRSDRLPAILFRTGTVLRVGPFVQLRVNYSTRMARSEDQAPAGYAGGFTVILMESADGWVLVHGMTWIT